MAPFSVTILGTSSAVPAYGRFPSSQVVVHNSRLFIIDAGEGLQFQLQKYKIRLRHLDAVFISHLHGDHVYGLPGLLTSLSIYGRTEELILVGPPGIKQILDTQFKASDTRLHFSILFREIEIPKPGEILSVFENKNLLVACFSLKHRIPCLGYRFIEKTKQPHFLPEKALAYNIPQAQYHLLKQGNNINLADGTVVEASWVLGEADPPYSYCYCSDTLFTPDLATLLAGTTLLYHEATFLHNLLARAKETGHSTALQAGQFAQLCNVQHLIIGHFSARYQNLEPLLSECKSVFENTLLAQEGKNYPIPYIG